MLPHGHISLLVLSEESWWTMPSFGHPSFYLQMRLNLHDQLKVECKKQSMQFTKNKPSLSDARRLASTHRLELGYQGGLGLSDMQGEGPVNVEAQAPNAHS